MYLIVAMGKEHTGLAKPSTKNHIELTWRRAQ
jgi:hypothetical protein